VSGKAYGNPVPFVAPFLVFTAAGLAALAEDWNWAAVSLISGFAAMVPPMTGMDTPSRAYPVFLFPYVAYAVLMAVDYVAAVPYAYETGLALFGCAGFSLAFYAMSLMRHGGYAITGRWAILMSVAAGWAVTSFAVFGVFAYMDFMGEPIYNWHYEGTGLDNDPVNWTLMMPMVFGMPAVIVYSVVVRTYLARGGGGA